MRASLVWSATALVFGGCANGTDVSSPSVLADGGGQSGTNDDGDGGGGSVIPGPDDGTTDPDGGVSDPDGGDVTEPDAGDTEEPVGCTDKIVINEVMPEGTNNEEFIELYNPNDCTVSIGKWKVVYQSKSGSADETKFTFSSSQSIGSKKFFLIGTNTISGKDGSFTGGLGNAGGQLALVNDSVHTIDAVGFGDTTSGAYVEGSPVGLPGAGRSIARVPDGHDTDDNSADFKTLNTPTPGKANK